MSKIVSTKISIPRLETSVMLRPHLMAQYELGLHRQLTLVSAPAGYGKTTSTILWLRSLEERRVHGDVAAFPKAKAWYSLDPEDNDIITFSTRLIAAIEEAMPGCALPLPTMMSMHPIEVEQYAHALTAACLEWPQRVIVVIDDYHVIDEPAIHELVCHLVRYASPQLHFVITARHDPPLNLTRLRAANQVAEIRTTHLLLTHDESRTFLQLRLDEKPQGELFTQLFARTEGWIAGLQLAAAAIHVHGGQDAFARQLRHGESRYVLDYLFDEVLNHETPIIQEFLVKTALLDRFNVELAAHITGIATPECRKTLDELRRQDLFVVGLDDENVWVRYHRQFQAMLVNRAQSIYAEEVILRVRGDAAAWLIEHDWIDEALTEYIVSKEWDKAAELIILDCHRLQKRELWNQLWRRIAQLPDAVTARRPELLLAQAWIMQVNDRTTAIPPLLERVESLMTASVDDSNADSLWGEVYALRGSWIFPDRSPQERAESMQRALHRLPAAQYAWIRGFVFIQMAYLLVGQGEAEIARDRLLREIDAHGFESGSYLTRLQHARAVIAYLDGSLTELADVGERFLELAERNAMTAAIGWARYGLGWVYWQRCQTLQAWETLAPIFDHSHDHHLTVLHLALSILVPAASELGQTETISPFLSLVRKLALSRDSLTTSGEIASLYAYAALYSGEVRAATTWVDEFAQTYQRMAPAQRRGPGLTEQILIMGKISLASGSADRCSDAIEPLRSYIQGAELRGAKQHIIQGAVLVACCYWRIGHKSNALAWMKRAVEVGVPRGLRRVFFEQGADVAAILYAITQSDQGAAVAAAQLLAEYQAWSSGRPAPTQVADGEVYGSLTEREEEILGLMAEQLSNKEIARRLDISPFTVRNHTSNIFSKLNVTTRRQAVAQAQTLGLLPNKPLLDRR